jgi:hypothetical protein
VTYVLTLLFVQAIVGAFDTVYYHEWRARLPARGSLARSELVLHAVRDYLYALIFCALPWTEWRGRWCLALALVVVAEIVFTLWDFLVEAVERKPIGDVYPGERVTHAIMGIIYGAMLAFLVPVLIRWLQLPSAIAAASPHVSIWMRALLSAMGIGVFVSGVRDLYAAFDLPGGAWPWPRVPRAD